MTTITTWNEHATLHPDVDGRYRAEVGDAWTSLKGAHGGVVASLMLDAVERELASAGVGSDTVLRAATFGYVSGNDIGTSTIGVEVIRRGRSMVTSHAHVVQNGATTTVGRFHHSSARTGLEYSDVEPLPAKPADAVRFEGARAKHLRNVETFFRRDTQPFGGGDRAEWMAWCRPLQGSTFGTSWLTMFGDYFPPAVFARLAEPTPAVTIEYSLQIHDDAGSWTLGPEEYLAAHVHTFHSSDGFAVEDGRIHLPDGSLLATVRQTRLAG